MQHILLKYKKAAKLLLFLILILGLSWGLKLNGNSQDIGVRAQTTTKKNIVLILTDDQAFQTLEYMPRVKLYLYGKSTRFSNAFVTTPLCCPSRASILTGKYVHNHEVKGNFDWKKFNDTSTIATWLQSTGYTTGHFGKYFNEYDGSKIPPGWNNFVAFITNPQPYDYTLTVNGKKTITYGSDPRDYSTDVLSKQALNFLKKTGTKPFFLYFSTSAPHYPYTPAPRHLYKYALVPQWRPPNYNEEDVSDKPQWVKELPVLTPTNDTNLTVSYRRYLETLLAVDEAFYNIYAEIQRQGKLNDTVIIITSDNGLTWGEHRNKNSKDCEFEECIRVPMLIYYPGLTTSEKIEDRFVLNIDLAPTIAEIAGVTPAHEVDGRSLIPILNGSITDWRSDFLIETMPSIPLPPTDVNNPFNAVRTIEWKYIDRYATSEKQLYNLGNDPYELVNLASDSAYLEVVASMSARLEELKAE